VLWVAEHRALRTEVAIKFLGDDRASDPAAARRVAREAAAAARVKSPHVVQVLDHGVWQGTPFIVMELLEGCDLGAHLAARGALALDETAAILHQLARALEKAHSVGVVHRDVKPSNVFLCDAGGEVFVKLLDFGLAQAAASLESSISAAHAGAGTPPYMSPEQLVGEAVDGRSDIWSMGALAFHCLTGKRPFDGESLGAIALAVHTLSMPRPSELRPGLPPAVDDWFARVCARARDERFASAVDAALELARALGVDLSRVHSRHASVVAPRPDPTVTDDYVLTASPAPGGARSALGPSIAVGVLAASLVAGAVLARRATAPLSVAQGQGQVAPASSTGAIPVHSPSPPGDMAAVPAAPADAPPASAPPAVRPPPARVNKAAPQHPPPVPSASAPPIEVTPEAPRPELPDERH
jgi:serine/threonine protein kinase